MANRTLLEIIKVHLEGEKGAWPKKLPNVLWAYKTTTRTLTKETPFRFTYGTKVVIPVEVRITNKRILSKRQQEQPIEGQLGLPKRDKRGSIQKNDQVPAKDDQILQQKSKAQKTEHKRFCLTQNHTSNKGPNIGKARTNLGRTLQDHPLLKARKLSLGIDGREETATTMEHQAFEKVSSLGDKPLL